MLVASIMNQTLVQYVSPTALSSVVVEVVEDAVMEIV